MSSTLRFILAVLFLLASFLPTPETNAKELAASPVTAPPPLDNPDAPVWNTAEPVAVLDAMAGIPITLRALHDNERIYIQATYPDPTADRVHRLLRWDPAKRAYFDGPEREDALVLKWSMSGPDTGLTLHENAPYVADIWFWKACRSDHAGHADDKIQTYSMNPSPYALALLSRNGKIFYLTRKGDQGQAAEETILYPEYAGGRVPKFKQQTPEGSRADILAKGIWKDGQWTITFARKLDTGHDDDVAFDTGKAYVFGVSRFEIAGRPPEPESNEPLFGSGEVGETLTLRFRRQ